MWYERFNSYLLQTRFTKCVVNPNIYIKCVSTHFVLGHYVNDDEHFLHGIKYEFSSAFEMTNIKPIKFHLGILVSRNVTNHSIHLSQKKYLTYFQTFWDARL
jgi:hypothetical protein